MGHQIDLTVVWALICAFSVLGYVVMDGFDLGIGILFASFRVGKMRDEAMNAIAPVWDGNETWLVLGGGALLAVFPIAYSIILPATYPLMIAMLLGLVFRGVAFEFRWRNPRHRPLWDVAFTIGSATAALARACSSCASATACCASACATCDSARAYSASAWFKRLSKSAGSSSARTCPALTLCAPGTVSTGASFTDRIAINTFATSLSANPLLALKVKPSDPL